MRRRIKHASASSQWKVPLWVPTCEAAVEKEVLETLDIVTGKEVMVRVNCNGGSLIIYMLLTCNSSFTTQPRERERVNWES